MVDTQPQLSILPVNFVRFVVLHSEDRGTTRSVSQEICVEFYGEVFVPRPLGTCVSKWWGNTNTDLEMHGEDRMEDAG